MQLLDRYNEAIQAVHDYFGYVEDWVRIPLDDGRDSFWRIVGGEAYGGWLHYADSEEELNEQRGNYYVSEIYTQRFLPKWVYRGAEYTLVSIDTRTDGNKYLIVLDNAKERARTPATNDPAVAGTQE